MMLSMNTPHYLHEMQPLILGNLDWQKRVSHTYFDLNVTFQSPKTGSGRLCDETLDTLGFSCLQSSPIQYLRSKASAVESYFLITLPLSSRLHMQQCHRDVTCEQGHILLQHANDPYLFEHAQDNMMWVVKVPSKLLQKYVPCPEIYTAMAFDGLNGVGRLFSQNVSLLGEELLSGRLNRTQEHFYSDYLLTLFAQVLQQDNRIVFSEESSIREAQLYKVKNHILHHLQDAGLSPQTVATACGISLRYIHNLFKNQDITFTQFVQKQRLRYAFELLSQTNSLSITEIAYQSGFNDQSHFTRLFKQTYQFTPKEIQQHKHLV
ncbi:helix-turn-helix domain-containing protein [Vitreoscilla stercoraria]|uniref:Helix-turn-helix domain-containing protein n=2 Tax=Neisseriaceae TaxID=481 RepID=A0ABY4E7Q3_VITST|nr:helix-turn-helix domain-containing protein [Vitreoscilla stercoraria]UOO91371.1 helix-turn-helix domain-containing protein [Vitreoscilla stercoraria]